MEISPYVNLRYVSEFLEGEIKQISERWGQFMINKIALERVLKLEVFPDEVEADYNFVIVNTKGKKPVDVKRFMDEKLDIGKRLNYEKIKEYKDKEDSLNTAKKGLKEFEEFLEVVTGLKHEIDEFIKKRKIITGE